MTSRSFDLSAFAAALRHRGTHLHLADRIDAQADMASRVADLDHAAELVQQLTELQLEKKSALRDGRTPSVLANAEGAMLAQAIVLYVRSTGRGDRRRSLSFEIESLLTPEQVDVHRAIRGARNMAIAHFDGEDRQDWHRDCLVITKHSDHSWNYGSPYSRTTYRRRTHSELQMLLGVLLPRLRKDMEGAMDELNAVLQTAIASEPALEAAVEAHPFDPATFYGTSLEADDLAEIIQAGGTGNFVRNASNMRVRESRGSIGL